MPSLSSVKSLGKTLGNKGHIQSKQLKSTLQADTDRLKKYSSDMMFNWPTLLVTCFKRIVGISVKHLADMWVCRVCVIPLI